MTLAYLRGGLSAGSVLLVEFQYFSLNILMQLCKNFIYNYYGSYLLFQNPFTLAQPCF